MVMKRIDSFRICVILFLIYNDAIIPTISSPQGSRNQKSRAKRGTQPCSKFQFEGYHCIPEDKCGSDHYEIEDTIVFDQIRSAAVLLNTVNIDFDPSVYYCESESDICCRKSEFFGQLEPVIRTLVHQEYDCEDFTDFGYDCVDELQCGEDGYYEDENNSGRVFPRSVFSFASSMSCECTDRVRSGFESLVCCKKASFFHKREPPEFESDEAPTECSKWKKDGFKCVEKDNCQDDHFDSGRGVPAIRSDDNFVDISTQRNTTCAKQGEVCCRSTRFFDRPFYTEPDIIHIRSSYTPQCGQHIEFDGVDLRQDIEDGAINEDGTSDLTVYSDAGEWPHMCTIFRASKSIKKGDRTSCTRTLTYVCGASLISQNAVLTTWHNIRNIPQDEMVVRCGEWSFDDDDETIHQDRAASDVHFHPDAKFGFKQTPENDFAVVLVEEDFILNEFVDTICLPESVDDYDTSHCYATGYGRDNWDSKKAKSRVLKKILMDVEKDHSVCERELRLAKKPNRRQPTLGQTFRLDSSFLCAGGNRNEDTCIGDGGSPLVCPGKVEVDGYPIYFQVGIVSWGIGCQNGNPGVYSNVTSAIDFINSVLNS